MGLSVGGGGWLSTQQLFVKKPCTNNLSIFTQDNPPSTEGRGELHTKAFSWVHCKFEFSVVRHQIRILNQGQTQHGALVIITSERVKRVRFDVTVESYNDAPDHNFSWWQLCSQGVLIGLFQHEFQSSFVQTKT